MNIIPAEYYFDTYINLCLIGLLFTLLHTWVLKIDEKKNIIFINVLGFSLLVFFILFIGQRQITSRYGFGDTANYFKVFSYYSRGGQILSVNDYGWHVFMKWIAAMGSFHIFMTICAFLYIFPFYKISKNLFGNYWYYSFIMFISAYSFYAYGVNGVRNGVALSLFLWGLSYRNNKAIMAVFFLVATLFHKTALLPIIAYIFTYFYNNPKVFLKGWLLCIPMSLAFGGIFINLFASLGFGDDRLSAYLTSEVDPNSFASIGFRWDFLFHSAFAVFAGWYFIYKKNYKDRFYNQLLNTYLICNGFWILVINANFSNRFAYLSWFMMTLVIIYPFLKQQLFKNQHVVIGKLIFLFFAFTYFMSYVYYQYIK